MFWTLEPVMSLPKAPAALSRQICTTTRFWAQKLSCKCHAFPKNSCNSKSASVTICFLFRNRYSHTPTLFQNRSLVLEKSYFRDPALQSCSGICTTSPNLMILGCSRLSGSISERNIGWDQLSWTRNSDLLLSDACEKWLTSKNHT